MDVQEVQPARDRVRERTSSAARERIDRRTRERVEEVTRAGPGAIRRRLDALEREWELDRVLMANFAVVGGLVFAEGLRRVRGIRKHNGWLAFFASQIGFMGLHALIGWCPPSVVFRRLGVRTAKEISAEREALAKALERTGPPGAG